MLLGDVPEQTQRLKNYTLVEHLAVGGMGDVWLARQDGPAGFSRPVVIKRILPSLSSDPQFIALFLNEARLAARLTHPNVVQLIELAEEAGQWFMAMEYVQGQTLRGLQRIAQAKGERLSPMCVAAVASQSLLGLHSAHQLKDETGTLLRLVHRDVSPDNLMVSFEGIAKVLDFGIAKAAASAGSTSPDVLRGKLAYVSPELVLNTPVDGRSDVFSMGVVMYELLTGRRPFVGDSDAARLLQVVQVTPPPVGGLNPEVHPALAEVVERAMAKEPEMRWASAEAMHLALDEAMAVASERVTASRLGAWVKQLAGDPIAPLANPKRTATFARPMAEGEVTDPTPVRRRRRLLLGVGLAVSVAVAVVIGMWPIQRQEPPVVDAGAKVEVVVDAGLQVTRVVTSPSVEPDAGQAEVPRFGRVHFVVKPWADVFLGGKLLGTTPFAPLKMSSGTKTFVLKNGPLGVEKKVTVVVKPGKLVEVRERLMP